MDHVDPQKTLGTSNGIILDPVGAVISETWTEPWVVFVLPLRLQRCLQVTRILNSRVNEAAKEKVESAVD